MRCIPELLSELRRLNASHCALPSERLGFGDDGILLNGDGVDLGGAIETTFDKIDVALPGHCCLDGLELRRSSAGGVGVDGVIEGRLRRAGMMDIDVDVLCALEIASSSERMSSPVSDESRMSLKCQSVVCESREHRRS